MNKSFTDAFLNMVVEYVKSEVNFWEVELVNKANDPADKEHKMAKLLLNRPKEVRIDERYFSPRPNEWELCGPCELKERLKRELGALGLVVRVEKKAYNGYVFDEFVITWPDGKIFTE